MFRKSLALILVAVSACCVLAGCSENSDNSENTASAVTEPTTEEATIAPTTKALSDDTAAPIQEIEGIKLKAEYDSEKETIHITVENHTEADVVTDGIAFRYYKANGDETVYLGNSLKYYSTAAYIMPEAHGKIFEKDYKTDVFLDADFSKDKFIIQGEFDYYKDVEFMYVEEADFYIPQIDKKTEGTPVILTGKVTLKQ